MKTPFPLKGLLPSFLAAGIILSSLPASAALKHRYSFNEAAGSTTVTDSVSGSNGVARVRSSQVASGAVVPTFDGSQVTLDGLGGYVDLPNRLVSTKTNITLEFWVTWTSGGTWTRIMDFGTNSLGEDVDGTLGTGNGGNYIFLAATAGSTPRFAITTNAPAGNGGEAPILNSSIALTQGEEHYVVVTYGPGGAAMFIDGNQVGSAAYAGRPLSGVQDANVWLGRSNWNDPWFGGSFNEFRIHDSILGQLALLASRAGGPNSTNYTPEAPTSITLVANPTTMVAGTAQTPTIDATFPTYGQVIVGATEVTMTSSDTNIVRIEAGNVLRALKTGTATITANLSGKTDTETITVVPPVAFTKLKHRYGFNEASGSTTVADSVGGAAFAGIVYAPTTNTAAPVVVSNGVANFPGGAQTTAGYIALPQNMISTEFTNVTIEFWLTWNGPAGGNTWARVFDFGSSTKAAGPTSAGNGLDYITFTPRRNGGGARTEFRASADNSTAFVSTFNDQAASPGFPVGREAHVVATFAAGIGYSSLTIDGFPISVNSTPFVGTPPTAFQLSQLVDPNIWLGMSQYADPPLDGKINELRIHEGILDEMTIALSRKAGANALPIADAGTLQSIALQVSPLYMNNPAATQAVLLGNYANISGLEITGFDGVQYQSSDTNIFTVTATGAMTSKTNVVGTANLIATYKAFSVTSAVSVLAPVALSSATVTTNANGVSFALPLFADFPGGVTNVNVTGFVGVARSSADTNIVAINNAGTVTFLGNPGSPTITSTYGGVTNVSTPVTLVGYTRGPLVNRWSFNEANDATTVVDSVGGKNGEVRNIQAGQIGNFTGTGEFRMGPGVFSDPPVSNAYINLPNGLISSLSSVTVEGWFTWFGGADNQRIFDFGMSDGFPDAGSPNGYAEDVVGGTGRAYFFLSPQTGRPRFAMKQGTSGENPSMTTIAALATTTSNKYHFAVVYDQPRGVARLYINGKRSNTAVASLPLSVVDDRNNWVGRSQWRDPYCNGAIDELRIYSGPALDSDIAADFAAGPNSLAVAQPTLSYSKTGNQLTLSWPVSAGAFTLKTSPVLGTGAIWASAGTPTVVGGNNQITVPTTSSAAFYRLEQ